LRDFCEFPSTKFYKNPSSRSRVLSFRPPDRHTYMIKVIKLRKVLL